jgi:opacity protein-like surface antigen
MEISGSGVYAEFFYAHRVSAPLSVEISLGIFNRGDFKYYAKRDMLVGGVNIYPIMISAKIYPLYIVNSFPLHPYLQAGGGLIYAKQDAISYLYDVVLTNDSETKFTYIFGAGVDWPLFDQIALCLNYKYIPAKFKNEMAGIRDYSGWQISFGAGYLFGSKRK